MKEPISTITNLAYGVAALVIIASCSGMMAAYVASTLFMLMFGSALFHGTLTAAGQAADEMAMYYVFTAIVADAGIGLLFTSSPMVPVIVAFCAGTFMALGYKFLDSFVAIPILVIMAIVLVGIRTDVVMSIYLVVAYLGAVLIRFAGQQQREGSALEEVLHGIWHVLTAAIIYVTWYM